MNEIATAVVFAICIGANVFLIVKDREPSGWLWFGAILAFLALIK